MRAVNLRYVRFVGRDCANFDEISEVLATRSATSPSLAGLGCQIVIWQFGVADEIIAREGREDGRYVHETDRQRSIHYSGSIYNARLYTGGEGEDAENFFLLFCTSIVY